MKLWLAGLALVVLAGILVGAGRLFTPLVSEFRGELAALASRTLGRPVEVEGLSGRWRGWGPVIVLRGFSVLDPETGRPGLEAARTEIAIDLLDSARAGAMVAREIALVGVRLAVSLERDGALRIHGLGLDEAPGEESIQDFSGLFLAPRQLSVRESEVTWKNRALAGPPLVFKGVDLRLRNDAGRHQLTGALSLSGYQGAELSLALDAIEGAGPAGRSTALYLKGGGFPLARLLADRVPDEYRLLNGLGDFELWGDLDGVALARLSGTAVLRDLIVEHHAAGDPGGSAIYPLDRLGATFDLDVSKGGWHFRGRDLRVESDGQLWPMGRLEAAAEDTEPEGRLVRVAGDTLPLAPLDALVRFLLPADHPLQPGLHAVAPDGDVHDWRLRLARAPGTLDWAASGEVAGLDTAPWGGLPGVDNLSFRFAATPSKGELELDAVGGALTFETLFRQPLPLDRLHGRVTWRQTDDGGWSIAAPALSASNRDIATRSRVSLLLPGAEGVSPFLDLQTDFREGDAAATSRYLPTGIMPPKVVAWLDRAIVSGRIPDGTCLVRGSLADFPFAEKGSGRFEVLFETEDLTLDYWPDWPPISRLNAGVRFLGSGFDAWASEGAILDSSLGATHARIANLRGGTLEIDGSAQGPLSDGLRFLGESPLRASFGALTREISGGGDIGLDLRFALPLANHGDLDLRGSLTFMGSRLRIGESTLPLTAISGTLEFDENRLWSRRIEARLLGEPISVVLEPDPRAETTTIRADGVFEARQLLREIGQEQALRVEGASRWTLQLEIPHGFGGRPVMPARLHSDLAGVSVDLPAPFGKEAGERRPLEISAELGPSAKNAFIVRYGQVLSAHLLLGEGERNRFSLSAAHLRLGGGTPGRPEGPGLTVTGELDSLNLSGLLEGGGRSPGEWPPLRRVGVGIGRLRFGALELDDLRLQLERAGAAWVGVFTSDQADGSARLPADSRADHLQLRLSRFEIETTEDADEGNGPPAAGRPRFDPEALPLVDLSIDRLAVNGRLLGTLSASTAGHPGGVELTNLTLRGPGVDLALYGTWRNRSDGGQETLLGFTLKSDGLGPLLSDLRLYADLAGAPGDAEGRLNWPGSPLDFELPRIGGDLAVQLGQGQLLELKPGLGRVLGLINVASIGRRLALDFSDVIDKGFAFDSIEGSVRFEDGDLFTNDLVVNGPSSRIELSGRSGLAARDLDYLVTVTPRISSTLPVAGTIAGGPLVGAALLVAQQIVGRSVDDASRVQYQVRGPWSEPEVTLKERPVAEAPDAVEPFGGD